MFGFGKRAKEKRARLSVADPKDPVLAKWFGRSNQTESGVFVDYDVALSVSTVYACVKVLSESVAILPLLLREDKDEEGDAEAKDYYLNDLLKKRPNRWQTPFEFKQMMVAHIALRGAFYAQKVYKSGRIAELVPLHPDKMTVFKGPDGSRAFSFQPPDGQRQIFLQDEIFYIPGQTDDGYKPMSVLTYAKEVVGLAAATQQYGSRFFKNNANPGGIMTHPGKMSDTAYQRLKEDWQKRHQGGANAHKVAILEEGMTWQSVGMTAQDAQFVESRKISPIEVCQFFRVPPHKVAILDRATFSNIEHQGLEFVTDTLMAYFVKIEQSADRDLLQNANEQKYFYRFDFSQMLRGDAASRYSTYTIGLQNRFLTRNEVRMKEGMAPVDGGDEFPAATNTSSPGTTPSPNPAPPTNPPPKGEQK